ncbi:MAG: hypothetical protein OXC27_09480 [Caldilineaceae bacterium]|nr:hypothetical protein [Caldilineaceae bacterium]
MGAVVIGIKDRFIGNNRAYIYIIYSRSWQFAYVGETNSRNGIIGRLNQHVDVSGSLRQHLFEKQGVDLDHVNDLTVFSYTLPARPEYIGVERVHRRGIEYLTQTSLRDVSGDLEPFLKIVSNVSYSDTCSLKSIRSIAAKIIGEFVSTYSKEVG